jgi:hypothetical protein
MMQTYNGQCHCGKLSFTVEADLSERKAVCRCTRCNQLGFLHHHVPRDRFHLSEDSERWTTEYTFNTGQAKHRFCKVCGVQPYYISRSDPDMFDINLRCLIGIDIYEFDYELSDGKNWEEYQAARRERERSTKETGVPYLVDKWRILWRNPFPSFNADQAFRSAWEKPKADA